MDNFIKKLLLASGAQRVKYVNAEGKEFFEEAEGGELLELFPTILSNVIASLERGSLVMLEDDACSVTLTHIGEQIEVTSNWHGVRQTAFLSVPKHVSIDDLDSGLKDSAILNEVGEKELNLEQSTFIPQDQNEEVNSKFKSDYSWMSPFICERYQLKAPYVAGAMAGGIASVELVQAMSEAGFLSFFGSGGLPLSEVEKALSELSELRGVWGANLLHSPHDIELEEKTVDLYLKYGVRIVSASAYMRLTPAVVRYRLSGISADEQGRVHTPNQIFAKVSHPSVAEQFLAPPPQAIVQLLLKKEAITEEQALLSQRIPMAEQLTVEGDSGGHTDGRPLLALFPVIHSLKEQQAKKYGFIQPIFIGAAGGLGTPQAMASALMLGADYLLIGSVHQSTVEAGTSDQVKEMLAQASVHDFSMGVSPDMFEQGAMVQVLSRGSMYAQRANRLRELYLKYRNLDDLPQKDKDRLEKNVFMASFEDIWRETHDYWHQRNPQVLKRVERDSHFKMALMFRWYLGQSSRWARKGNSDRKRDFQIWSGPAMGAFNNWVRGTPLEPLDKRSVVDVAEALLDGTAAIFRSWKQHLDVI